MLSARTSSTTRRPELARQLSIHGVRVKTPTKARKLCELHRYLGSLIFAVFLDSFVSISFLPSPPPSLFLPLSLPQSHSFPFFSLFSTRFDRTFFRDLTRILFLPLFLSLSFSSAHAHTHTHTQRHSLSLSLFLCLSFALSLSHTLFLFLSLFLVLIIR